MKAMATLKTAYCYFFSLSLSNETKIHKSKFIYAQLKCIQNLTILTIWFRLVAVYLVHFFCLFVRYSCFFVIVIVAFNRHWVKFYWNNWLFHARTHTHKLNWNGVLNAIEPTSSQIMHEHKWHTKLWYWEYLCKCFAKNSS